MTLISSVEGGGSSSTCMARHSWRKLDGARVPSGTGVERFSHAHERSSQFGWHARRVSCEDLRASIRRGTGATRARDAHTRMDCPMLLRTFHTRNDSPSCIIVQVAVAALWSNIFTIEAPLPPETPMPNAPKR